MLKRISKFSFFVQLCLFVVVAAIMWIPGFMHPNPIIHLQSEGPLYSILVNLLSYNPYWLVSASFIFVLSSSFILYIIGSVNDLLPRENFISPILFLFLFSWNPKLMVLNPILPAGILILLSINTLMRMYGQSEPYRQVFSASVFIALASLFYFPAMYFMLMIWISLVTYRISSWREWIIALIGFSIPILYLVSWYFWNDRFSLEIVKILSTVEHPGIMLQGVKPYEIAWIILTMVLLLITLFSTTNLIQDKLISTRRKTIIMINFLSVCILVVVFSGSSILLVSQLVYISLAFFISLSISLLKKSMFVDIVAMCYLIFLVFARLFLF